MVFYIIGYIFVTFICIIFAFKYQEKIIVIKEDLEWLIFACFCWPMAAVVLPIVGLIWFFVTSAKKISEKI